MYAALHPFCDVATARSAATRNTAGHPQLVLATTILASSLAFIDGSVVNVGLSAIGHSLAADAAGLQWIINAYLLPLSALLCLAGRPAIGLGVGVSSWSAPLCLGLPHSAARLRRTWPRCSPVGRSRASVLPSFCRIALPCWARRFPARRRDARSASGRPPARLRARWAPFSAVG